MLGSKRERGGRKGKRNVRLIGGWGVREGVEEKKTKQEERKREREGREAGEEKSKPRSKIDGE